jgi:hypothetical protein
MASKFVLYPNWMERVLRAQDAGKQPPRYRVYALHRMGVMKNLAISIFTAEQIKSNEWRLSNMTPPKYISSFRTEYVRGSFKSYLINDDPGWVFVEFGTHPGGNAGAYVRPYRPMRTALRGMPEG